MPGKKDNQLVVNLFPWFTRPLKPLRRVTETCGCFTIYDDNSFLYYEYPCNLHSTSLS